MKSFAKRLIGTLGLGAAAFVSGAAVDSSPAGAHCGDHAASCDFTFTYRSTSCQAGTWVDWYDQWYNSCSGTCYNGGTSGCCESPEACNDAPCKPGGCGGACGWQGVYQENTGVPC